MRWIAVSLEVEAAAKFAKGDKKACGYTDVGVALLADWPWDGVSSKYTKYGKEVCRDMVMVEASGDGRR